MSKQITLSVGLNDSVTGEQKFGTALMDVSEQIAEEIAKDLCVFFNQESVMVTVAPSSVIFVKEKLENDL